MVCYYIVKRKLFCPRIMCKKDKLFLTVIHSCVVLFTACALSVKAQVGVRVPIKSVAKPQLSSAGPRISTQAPKIQRVIVPVREVRRETKIVNVKTNDLVVFSEPGAKILLEGLVRGVKPATKGIPKDNSRDKTVVFENLRAGKYKVTASLDGYKTQETEVTIVPQKNNIGINLDLEPYTYKLNLETNVTEGEVRFAPAQFLGTNPDGSLKTIETGGYCIVPIKNKKAIIDDLQKGYYNIDIRPSAVEYEPVLTAINVPTEIPDEKDAESNELQSYSFDLQKKISTGTFSSAWINDEWVLPPGWKLQDRQMKTAGIAGIALPRNEQYRYYTNFEMISDVILKDGKTIGFALRAVDPQNFYLIQISGANAPERFLASGYVIKNNKSSPSLFSNPIDHFSKTIQARKSFRVIIKGENNTFKIYIEDSQNGDRLEVGNMIDRDNNFRKGAVGIVGRENSASEVGLFTVCASSCR